MAMLLALVSGSWRDMLWPGAAAIARTVPMIVVMLLPMLVGLDQLFAWSHEQFEGFRGAWLSPGSFIFRAVLYASAWIALARWILPLVRLRPELAAVGAILMVLTVSAAGIDWIMTLDRHFHSSIFGLLYLGRSMLSGIALAILFALSRHAPRPGVLRGLLAAAVHAWLYLHFMQYLLIWSADLPREINWYEVRAVGVWAYMLWVIALGQGALVALALLFPWSERPGVLATLSLITLALGLLESAWLVLPALEGLVPVIALVFALAAWLGFGGLVGTILAPRRVDGH
ncbi:hypothetical protein [Pseudomonas sp. N8]|uniref:hypothetical protein n=1 Tax=Pseudomonas sp. N8 TaxID=3449428 RepID=UPI003F698107